MKNRIVNIVLATSIICAPASYAAGLGGYVGISGGKTKAKDIPSASAFDAQNAADGFATNTSVDDTDTGWKIFGGYKFNQYIAVEGSYTDFGEATADSVVTASPFGTGTFDQTYEATALGLAAVGTLPLKYNFDLFGKAGIHYWDAEWTGDLNLTSLSGSVTEDDNGTDFFYGIGAAYNFTPWFAVRAEWEVFNDIGDDNTTGKTDIEMWSAGLQYSF